MLIFVPLAVISFRNGGTGVINLAAATDGDNRLPIPFLVIVLFYVHTTGNGYMYLHPLILLLNKVSFKTTFHVWLIGNM